ncbi:leucine-rich repeat-containing protein 4B [Scaptodrosophila lebanonensis]|uniref:Leucine-rich repeat-containing protein 4B n=1 Tax=Drosophila lebanonensis TaxID=7225 RepID=A0A6J2UHA7_DROLE|nr:leucine-rich repeat-containing protein 4B [Scaptodrosophila lebanonensis]
MDLHWLLLTIFCTLGLSKALAFVFVNQDEHKCKYGRIEKLMRIRCHDMNLKEVPQFLKTSVEVLDLSFNRIRKLKKASFEKYTDIKFLILYENMISSVEPGTFSQLTALQEIDLSNNGLTTIPMELFQLPKLRNLYADSNDLVYLEQDLQTLTKPIRAPLEYLNIANCELHDIPDLGILPNLWQLNASSNPLQNFNIDKLANLCHMSVIDLTKTQISQCSCQQVNNHLYRLKASPKFVPVCMDTLGTHECPLPYNRTVDSATFHSCLNRFDEVEAQNLWIFVCGCIGGSIVVLLVVWYCIYKWRKRRAKKKPRQSRAVVQNRKNFVISPRNAINNRQVDEGEPLAL